jgi:hypothetical protein
MGAAHETITDKSDIELLHTGLRRTGKRFASMEASGKRDVEQEQKTEEKNGNKTRSTAAIERMLPFPAILLAG